MKATDRKEFFAVLARTFETFGKPLPSGDVLTVWWTKLEPFPIEVVCAAFSRHIDTSEFPPVPAAILKLLPRESDGHVQPDEAWSIAVRLLDERNTVVWNSQIAEAWGKISHLADGDETAARMAFRAAYADVLDRARALNTPAKWVVTLGWDVEQREQIVTEAVRQNRLSIAHAKAAVPLLAGPSEESAVTPQAEQQLAKLRSICAGIGAVSARAAVAGAERAREAIDDLARAKQQTAARVAAYEASHA
ncbi:hypothetical protein [Paraburkholderia bannensis]|uniref:hypothetical protein n=1 Tax=Paraburkholderia bannensis TaxID=765414 RepID=UPI0004873747|nr:hypothetical protein [Paraburkholderia bannensis]